MLPKLYRFHCTDGRDLVADLRGARLPTVAQMRRHADRVALDLMLGMDRFDWARWQVEVYDSRGRRVWVRPFEAVDVDAAEAA